MGTTRNDTNPAPYSAADLVFCVDLDGVVGDYTAAFRRFVARACDVDEASIGPQTCWDFVDVDDWPITSREQFLDLHNAAVAEGMFATMPEIPGASDALWRLSDAGVWIRIVTHRLVTSHFHAAAAGDTVAWLEAPRPDGRPRVPYRDLCFLGAKVELTGSVFIDDGPHNVTALRGAGRDVITFDAPYNRHLDGLRATDWDQVCDLVLAKADWLSRNPMR